MNNRTAYLVSKKLTGEISESEIQELNLHLIQDPDLYETISLLEIAWNAKFPHLNEKEEVEGLIRKLQQAEPDYFASTPDLEELPSVQPVKSRLLIRFLQAAAAVLVLSLGIWWVIGNNNHTQPSSQRDISFNQVATKAGSRTQIVLRDGTKVWLNGDSRLSYSNVTDGETRDVRLSGEAYFDVAHNPARPFIIHTEKTTVKVTGTTLNVRDYPGEEKAETSLLSGKAEVVAKTNPDRIFVLKPNQKVVFSRHEEVKTVKEAKSPKIEKVLVSYRPKIMELNYYPNDTIPVVTAWVADQLVFSDESFRDVADKMEKWYNVTIEIRSPKLAEARLNGKFTTETLPLALEALKFSTPFHYQFIGNKVIIDKH